MRWEIFVEKSTDDGYKVYANKEEDRREYWLRFLVYKNMVSAMIGRRPVSCRLTVRYKKIGYNIDVLRQTACLVVNPIKVNNFAYLFDCTTVGRASD